MIKHKSIINVLDWQIKTFHVNENDTTLLNYSFSFDPSILVIFSSLLSGAKLIILKNSALKNPEIFLNAIYDH